MNLENIKETLETNKRTICTIVTGISIPATGLTAWFLGRKSLKKEMEIDENDEIEDKDKFKEKCKTVAAHAAVPVATGTIGIVSDVLGNKFSTSEIISTAATTKVVYDQICKDKDRDKIEENDENDENDENEQKNSDINTLQGYENAVLNENVGTPVNIIEETTGIYRLWTVKEFRRAFGNFKLRELDACQKNGREIVYLNDLLYELGFPIQKDQGAEFVWHIEEFKLLDLEFDPSSIETIRTTWSPAAKIRWNYTPENIEFFRRDI